MDNNHICNSNSLARAELTIHTTYLAVLVWQALHKSLLCQPHPRPPSPPRALGPTRVSDIGSHLQARVRGFQIRKPHNNIQSRSEQRSRWTTNTQGGASQGCVPWGLRSNLCAKRKGARMLLGWGWGGRLAPNAEGNGHTADKSKAEIVKIWHKIWAWPTGMVRNDEKGRTEKGRRRVWWRHKAEDRADTAPVWVLPSRAGPARGRGAAEGRCTRRG